MFKNQVFLDAKFLRMDIQQEVSGMLTRLFALAGRGDFNRHSDREKRTRTIVPGLVTNHHPADSAIAAPGPRMWVLKQLHPVTSFNRAGS